MAKKAKAKKSKAKSGGGKTASIRVPLDEMARLFSVIARDPAATDDFMAKARKRKIIVTTDISTKIFVRRFLSTKGMLKKPSAAKTSSTPKTRSALKTRSAPKALGPAPADDRFNCFPE
jgi:hypothetical protein